MTIKLNSCYRTQLLQDNNKTEGERMNERTNTTQTSKNLYSSFKIAEVLLFAAGLLLVEKERE